jgi:hydroxypyruvate isomerase
MELLNSKVDHADYMCDRTPWGVELCDRIGSDRFKLLYDIYHMQIMEGDVIRTIRDNAPYIVHYHTGGNPGRHEINDTQELYYPAIMRAIVETGFTGFVAQEFIPTRENKAGIPERGAGDLHGLVGSICRDIHAEEEVHAEDRNSQRSPIANK